MITIKMKMKFHKKGPGSKSVWINFSNHHNFKFPRLLNLCVRVCAYVCVRACCVCERERVCVYMKIGVSGTIAPILKNKIKDLLWFLSYFLMVSPSLKQRGLTVLA
jgi:hypothetical protein